QNVVDHRHRAKERQILERAAYSDIRHLVARHGRDDAPLEGDIPTATWVKPGKAVEQCAFACPVGAYQTADLALLNVEGNPIERNDAAKADRNAIYSQQGSASAIVCVLRHVSD